jgi:hypothetical protein
MVSVGTDTEHQAQQCSCLFLFFSLLTGYCRIKRFSNSSRTVVEQRKEFSLCFHGTVRSGTERNWKTCFSTLLERKWPNFYSICFCLDEEVIACTMLPRDIGLEALFFLPCQSIHLFPVSLYHYLERNRTKWTGTERNGTCESIHLFSVFLCHYLERNRTERKKQTMSICVCIYN